MDLNYLYHRRGKSLMMAARANCEPSRAAHLALAEVMWPRSCNCAGTRPPGVRMKPPISREEAADGLREQAASCRRLSKSARTSAGSTALSSVARQFDTDARRVDPASLRR